MWKQKKSFYTNFESLFFYVKFNFPLHSSQSVAKKNELSTVKVLTFLF